jgi:hypothetical protein
MVGAGRPLRTELTGGKFSLPLLAYDCQPGCVGPRWVASSSSGEESRRIRRSSSSTKGSSRFR